MNDMSEALRQAQNQLDMLPQRIQVPNEVATGTPPVGAGSPANPNVATKQDLSGILQQSAAMTRDVNEVKNTLRDLTQKTMALQVSLES